MPIKAYMMASRGNQEEFLEKQMVYVTVNMWS